jgi:ankyrin repeat protein
MALFDAILDNDFKSVRNLIITEGMNVDERNCDDTTGLHLASAAGNIEVLELLIECGANVNTVDTYMRAPLEYAVLYANFECASVLIENGADATLIQNGILLDH